MAVTDFNTAQQEQVRPAHPFAPMDPGVVSESIPAFFIGRNRCGFWVVRESKGRIGGLFLLQRSAIAFAHAQGGTAGCATVFPTDHVELDLENEGNPFAAQLAPLVRRWGCPGQRIVTPVRPELTRDQGYPS